MDDRFIELIGPLFASSWILLIVFVLAAVDAIFPLVPSESVVITAGAFAAATGKPGAVALVVAAALGAYAGDTLSYLLGRRAQHRIIGALSRTPRRRRTYAWAREALHRRGGQILVTARFVPGGRTATTLTAGAIGYPRRTFQGFAALAAVCWGGLLRTPRLSRRAVGRREPAQGHADGARLRAGDRCRDRAGTALGGP